MTKKEKSAARKAIMEELIEIGLFPPGEPVPDSENALALRIAAAIKAMVDQPQLLEATWEKMKDAYPDEQAEKEKAPRARIPDSGIASMPEKEGWRKL